MALFIRPLADMYNLYTKERHFIQYMPCPCSRPRSNLMITKLVSVIIVLSKFETLLGVRPMCSGTQWHDTIDVVWFKTKPGTAEYCALTHLRNSVACWTTFSFSLMDKNCLLANAWNLVHDPGASSNCMLSFLQWRVNPLSFCKYCGGATWAESGLMQTKLPVGLHLSFHIRPTDRML